MTAASELITSSTDSATGRPTWEIALTIRYVQPQDEFKYGGVEVTFADGTTFVPRTFLDLHDVLAAMCWIRPQNVAEWLDSVARDRNKALEDWHKLYMQSKYPGWPENYVDPKLATGRQQPAPVPINAGNIKIEDLDL